MATSGENTLRVAKFVDYINTHRCWTNEDVEEYLDCNISTVISIRKFISPVYPTVVLRNHNNKRDKLHGLKKFHPDVED